jgi:hypothetical protein
MRINEEKFKESYEYLVDLTEDPNVLSDTKKDETLSNLLNLFEYLCDTWEEDSPLHKFFE